MDDKSLADESRSQDEPPASPLPFWEVARLKILRARTITEPLPRIPPMTADIPPAMTLHELWDWKDKWTKLARAPTSQERRDLDECMRQENELGSETTYESDDPKELYMQTRRNFRKRPMSPPSTPPHLKGRKLPRTQDPSSELRDSSKVQKGGQKKQRSRIAPRRPMTRSWGIAGLSLHPHRKDHVLFWPTARRYIVLSHEKYLRDYVSLLGLCWIVLALTRP